MRQRHIADASTVTALQTRAMGRPLRSVAADLSLPQSAIATLSAVMRGQPGALTAESENELRLLLDLPPIHRYQVAPCPSCGGAHVLSDCHGAPVAALIALAPGERARVRRAPEPWVTHAAAALAALRE